MFRPRVRRVSDSQRFMICDALSDTGANQFSVLGISYKVDASNVAELDCHKIQIFTFILSPFAPAARARNPPFKTFEDS